MMKGKDICNTLKGIRKQIADENGIEYLPSECNYHGDCSGTCPKCEGELRYIENQLAIRKAAGKTIKIMGMMATMTFMTSCNPDNYGPEIQGKFTETPVAPTEDEDLQVMGEFPLIIKEEDEINKEEDEKDE